MKFNALYSIPPIIALILSVAERYVSPLTGIYQFVAFFTGIGFCISAIFTGDKKSKLNRIIWGICCILSALLVILHRVLFGPHIVILPPINVL